MMKFNKKLLSILLSVTVMLHMVTPVFAIESTPKPMPQGGSLMDRNTDQPIDSGTFSYTGELPSKDEVSVLLEQMYQRGSTNSRKNSRVMEKPLQTIKIDNSKMIHCPANSMPTPKLVMKNVANTHHNLMSSSSNQSGPFSENDERYFRLRVQGGYNDDDFRAVKGRLVAAGTNTNVWVADDEDFHTKTNTTHDDATCNLQRVTYPIAKDLATGFDGIYSRMTADFGPLELYEAPFEGWSYFGDFGDDKHVNILLYDIDALDNNGGNYTAGYFWSVDMYDANQLFGDSEVIHPIDMLHVDIGMDEGWDSVNGSVEKKLEIYGTLAHEFQHMLFHTHFGAYIDGENFFPSDYLWLNESLSGLAHIYYAQPGIELIGLGSMAFAATNPYDGNGYGDLFVFNSSTKNYSMGYLFSALFYHYTDGNYARNVYRFFDSLGTDKTLEGFNAKCNAINNTTIYPHSFDHVSAMLNSGLDLKLTDGKPLTALLTAYQYFMESFAADGGLKNGTTPTPTQKLVRGTDSEQNLWALRPLLGDSSNVLNSLPAIPTLATGGKIIIDGTMEGVPYTKVTRDMMYKLVGSGGAIHITVTGLSDDHKIAYAYVAIPNTDSATGADIYPLESDVASRIVTNNKDAYLFVDTFVTPLTDSDNVTVTYEWQDRKEGDLNGTATIDKTRPRIGDTLTGTYTGDDITADNLAYAWSVGTDKTIVGTDKTYTVKPADLGKQMMLSISNKTVTDGNTVQTVTATVKKKTYEGTAATPPTMKAVTQNSVTLNDVADSEYSNGGVIWQESPIFDGLSPTMTYHFYCRIKEAAEMEASEKSEGISIQTAPSVILTHTITASAGSGGTIAPSGHVSVTDGTNHLFSIAPNSGYSIADVYVDGVNQGAINRYTFSHITGNHSIDAYFRMISSGGNTGGGDSSSGNSGSTSTDRGNTSDIANILVTSPTADNPKNPTQVEIKVESHTDANGNATLSVTNTDITDALKKATEEARKNGNEANGVTVAISAPDAAGGKNAKSVTANLPKTVQDTLVENNVSEFKIVSEIANLTFDSKTLQQIQKQAGGDAVITASKADVSKLSKEAQTKIGNRPVLNLSITEKNGETISDFGGGSVTVSIPYTLQPGEDPNNLQAYFIDAKGELHQVTSTYDLATKSLVFVTNHFSIYGIGYKEHAPKFNDIEKHWAKNDIDFVVARGLLTGTGSITFAPDQSMTRGMFVTALGRLAKIDINNYKNGQFTDVEADAYYAPFVNWAASKGITNGTTATTFRPDQTVTRQEMAVFMTSYAKTMSQTLPKNPTAITFADSVNMASWAAEAVQSMQMAGILMGKDGNTFDPTGTATRAEVSASLRRYVELVMDKATARSLM